MRTSVFGWKATQANQYNRVGFRDTPFVLSVTCAAPSVCTTTLQAATGDLALPTAAPVQQRLGPCHARVVQLYAIDNCLRRQGRAAGGDWEGESAL